MAVSNEPPSITDGGENPDSWSHWDIYNSFNPLNTTNAHTASQNYSQLASGWESAVTFFNARIKQSSDAAWQGPAAEASRTAISNYSTKALELCDSLNAMSTQVAAAVDGVNGTKNGTDVPIQRVSSLNVWDGDFLWHHGDRSLSKINEERDKARAAMKDHYVTNFVAADKQIPQVPKPDGIGGYTPSSGYTPGSGISQSGSQSGSGGGGGGDGQSASGSGSGSGSDSGSQSSGTSGTSGTSSSLSGYQSPHASSSLSTQPSSYFSGMSASTMPSSFTGGTGTGVGSGGFDGGGGGGTPSGGGLGKSVPGTVGTTTGAAVTAAGTRAGGSTPGMAGMGGMGGAKGGKGEEDSSHEIPDWLRNMENTEELLGPQPKTIPGGVIGGDYDQDFHI